MLKLTPESLFHEYEAAHAKTKAVLSQFPEQIKQRAGPHYMKGLSADRILRRNVYHRWLSYVVPQLVWHDPRVQVGTLTESEGGEEFELELALNRLIVDSQMRKFLAAGPAQDMQYNFGVVMVTPEPVAGAKPIEGVGTDWAPGDPKRGAPPPRTPWMPKGYRIQQERYFEDALATTRDDIRLQGHIWVRDKDDILKEGAEGGWDVETIKAYAADTNLEDLARPEAENGDVVRRDEIVGADIYVAEYDLEEGNPWGVPASPGPEKGFHGTIFTILVNRAEALAVQKRANEEVQEWTRAEVKKTKLGGTFPRKPRPWYGPERGPYVIFGQFTVPNNSLPLGALSATEEEIKQLNIDLDVAQGMLRDYKQIALLSKGSDAEINAIVNGKHRTLHRVAGITKEDVIPLELGGITDQCIAHVEWSNQNLESTLGLSEMHSGNVSGVGTATEQTIAENAAQARFGGIQQTFEDGTVDMLWRFGWFLYEDNRAAMQLGTDAAQQLAKRGMLSPEMVSNPDGSVEERMPEPVYLGGARAGVKRLPYNALSVTIKPYSMERTSEARQQANAASMLGIVAQIVPMAAQFPGFPWADFADKLGDMANLPGLGRLFGKPDEIAASGIEVQQAMGAAQGGSGKIQPKVASMGGKKPQGGAGARPQRQAQSRGPAGSRSQGFGAGKSAGKPAKKGAA